jgi:hypothetical protein
MVSGRAISEFVALGPGRRPTHWLAGTILARTWRKNWVVGDADANRPSLTMARVRQAWKLTLPARSSDLVDDGAIAVMIPVGPRDLGVVDLAVDAVRANVLDPVSSITLVTPAESVDRLVAAVPGVTVVAEDTVLAADQVAMVRSRIPGARSSWYVQQLLKLNYCLTSPIRHTLVIDADTVLVRPQRFRTIRGDAIFVAAEYHTPYFDHLARLLGEDFSRPVFATTAHQMLYDRDVLGEITTAIERRHPDRGWSEAIIDLVDHTQLSGFSEGELYGQWMVQHHPSDISVHLFANLGRSRAELLPTTSAELATRYGDDYDSVSMHHYL